jgi:hypothetical protein
LDAAANQSCYWDSGKGIVCFSSRPQPWRAGWESTHLLFSDLGIDEALLTVPGKYGFAFQHNDTATSIQLPYWFVVLTFGSIAVVPWILWRFSLRTLLIATTLIAAVLGLIIVWSRWPAG